MRRGWTDRHNKRNDASSPPRQLCLWGEKGGRRIPSLLIVVRIESLDVRTYVHREGKAEEEWSGAGQHLSSPGPIPLLIHPAPNQPTQRSPSPFFPWAQNPKLEARKEGPSAHNARIHTHALAYSSSAFGDPLGRGGGSPSGPLGNWDTEHSPPGWKGKNRGQGKNSHDLKERESVQTRSDPVSEKGLLRRCKNPYLPLMDASISFPSTPSQGSHAIPFHLLKRDVSGIANTKFDELLFVLL